jgi:hypothetical protein
VRLTPDGGAPVSWEERLPARGRRSVSLNERARGSVNVALEVVLPEAASARLVTRTLKDHARDFWNPAATREAVPDYVCGDTTR